MSGLSRLASAIADSQQRWGRKPADFYPTPADVTAALLLALGDRLPSGARVLEPACGDGAMARVLLAAAYHVDATDLRTDSGYGRGGVDFLATAPGGYDAIITNPPFNLAERFIRQAVPSARITAMLLKSQYWHAARRRTLFDCHTPSDIYALTWRPSFLEVERGKSPLMDVIWTVWDANYRGPTRFGQLTRPDIRRRFNLACPVVHYSSEFDDLLGGDAPAELEDILG